MKVENCSNCERVIGKLEQAYVFHGNVVCQNCYQQLTDTKDKQVQAEVKKSIEVKVEPVPPQTEQEKSKHKVTKWYFPTSAVVIALLVLTVLLFYLVSYIHQKKGQLPALSEKDVKLKDQLPALSEKDVKLIEAFVHEMNLLVELQRADSETFKFQLAKLDAAYNDFSNLGSSNYSMLTMSGLALNVSLSYSLAHTYWDSSRFEEYEKSRNDASQSRENFLEVYHMLVHGTTVLEINKFLEDKVKNESTSK
jgi:hypothetical protein